MKQIQKLPFLFAVGGSIYYTGEWIFRGYSHWTMALLGGVCFIIAGLLNEGNNRELPFLAQMAFSALTITALEFIAGYILNIQMGLRIWDYSHLPFNVMGQICLPFTLLWFFLSALAIALDDLIRYWCFGEEKPSYRLF